MLTQNLHICFRKYCTWGHVYSSSFSFGYSTGWNNTLQLPDFGRRLTLLLWDSTAVHSGPSGTRRYWRHWRTWGIWRTGYVDVLGLDCTAHCNKQQTQELCCGPTASPYCRNVRPMILRSLKPFQYSAINSYSIHLFETTTVAMKWKLSFTWRNTATLAQIWDELLAIAGLRTLNGVYFVLSSAKFTPNICRILC